MAIVSPFRAFHYDPRKIQDLSQVITPPYDVIPPGDDRKYWDRSPYNFAHVDLPHSDQEDYSEATRLLARWRELGILCQDPMPSYYLYRQDFEVAGHSHTRDTLICAVKLHEFSEGVVRPHENTFGKHKADRLQLTRQTKMQMSHIFGAVKDAEGTLATVYEKWRFETPLLRATAEDGVRHTVWRAEAARFPEIASFFADKAIYIVDGHHRYESAVAYAKEMGVLGKADHPAAYTMFAVANVYDPGLVVLPTHRLVRGATSTRLNEATLREAYVLSELSFDELKAFCHRPHSTPEFALWLHGKLFRCAPKNWETSERELGKTLHCLGVVWSDRKFLPEFCGVNDENRGQKISYVKDLDQAWAQRAQADVVVFLAAPSMEQITHVANEKGFMPQKSTYFYPKLASGLTMREVVS